MTAKPSKEEVLEKLAQQYDLTFVNIFQQNGANVYLFGGAPRDIILNRNWKDADFCICIPEEVGDKDAEAERIFSLANIDVQSKTQLGHDKTVFRFKDKLSGGLIDVRVVNDIWAGGADFTVNALRYDLQTGEFIDRFNSIADIENRTLKTLESADSAFDEENFLLLRAIKAACQLGFEIDSEVKSAMKKYVWKLEQNIDFIINDQSDFAEWVLGNLFAGLRYNPHLYFELFEEVGGTEIMEQTLAKQTNRVPESNAIKNPFTKNEKGRSLEESISLFLSEVSRGISNADAEAVFVEVADLLKVTRPKQGDDLVVKVEEISYISN